MSITWIVFLGLFGSCVILISARNILIGTGTIKHSKYDTDEKRKSILRAGIIGLCLILISGGGLISLFF